MVTVRLSARLVDSSGNSLSGKTIYFYVSRDGSNWTDIGSAVTDSGGYASVTYNATSRTWFKAEFRGDDQYELASDTAVWEPSGGQPSPQPSQCDPLFRVGVGALDSVVFCVGGVGITVSILVIAFFMLLLFRRGR
jgi:hypothetical protein